MKLRFRATAALAAGLILAPVSWIDTLPIHAQSAMVTHTLRSGTSGQVTGPRMGPEHRTGRPTFAGFYDGHHDTYLNTDVSDKAQARTMGVNYAPGLAKVPIAVTPAIYLVSGRAAAGQLAAFGSEPGSSDYSPLWHEVIVRWKAGVHPVLLTSDNQILALARKGKLTMRQNRVILNCPIIHVGK